MNHILEEARKSNHPNEAKKHELTVSVANIGELMNNLTNLYKNPAEACFRETLSNAVDSHYNVAKNTSETIKITTPNRSRFKNFFAEDLLMKMNASADIPHPPSIHSYNFDKSEINSNLIISDFGTGMSRVQIEGNFLSYGNGTKKGDKAQIGGFGYGGKSPLAVNNIFHVQSVQDGVLNSFTVSTDPDDSSIPPSFEWDEGMEEAGIPTDLPNGVTVTVNYGEVDYAWAPSIHNLIGLPKNAINIDGYDWDITLDNETYFKPVKFSGVTVGYVANSSILADSHLHKDTVYVSVGNIVYPITDRTLLNSEAMSQLAIWNNIIVLEAPKHGVKFTPSRDEFIYNELTRVTLETLAADFCESVELELQSSINSFDDLFDVVTNYLNAVDVETPGSYNLTYRNEGKISEVLHDVDFSKHVFGVVYTDSMRNTWNFDKKKFHMSDIQPSQKSLKGFVENFANRQLLTVPEDIVTEEIVKGIRRYIVRITDNNDKFTHMSKIVVISESLLNSNKWTKAILGSVSNDYSTVLTNVKKAISDANKLKREAIKNGQLSAPTPKSKTALFVTATRMENGLVELVPHHSGKPSDLETGENFYYAQSSARAVNNFPLSGFQDSQKVSTNGNNRQLDIALDFVESVNGTLVVLSKRQDYEIVVKKLGAGAGTVEDFMLDYALTRVVPAPIPSFADFVQQMHIFKELLAEDSDYWSISRKVDNLKIMDTVFSKQYAKNEKVFELDPLFSEFINLKNVQTGSLWNTWRYNTDFNHYNLYAGKLNDYPEGSVEAIADYVETLNNLFERYYLLTCFTETNIHNMPNFETLEGVVDFCRTK